MPIARSGASRITAVTGENEQTTARAVIGTTAVSVVTAVPAILVEVAATAADNF
jgi:Ca2+/Na+ antiporter